MSKDERKARVKRIDKWGSLILGIILVLSSVYLYYRVSQNYYPNDQSRYLDYLKSQNSSSLPIYTYPSLNSTGVTDARTSLLSFYSGETTAHATIILSMFLGLFALAQIQKRRISKIILLLALTILFVGIELMGLRLIYWSQLSTVVLTASPFHVANAFASLNAATKYGVLYNLNFNFGIFAPLVYYSSSFLLLSQKGSLDFDLFLTFLTFAIILSVNCFHLSWTDGSILSSLEEFWRRLTGRAKQDAIDDWLAGSMISA